jgi:hypothetical protein
MPTAKRMLMTFLSGGLQATTPQTTTTADLHCCDR